MTSKTDNGFCNMVCWAIAALAGLLAAILLIYYGTWSSAGGIAVGVILFAVLGWLLSWLLCGIWADDSDPMAHEMEVRRRTSATGAGTVAAGAAAAGVAGVAAAGAATSSTASSAAGAVSGADEAAAAERQRAADAEAERQRAAEAERQRAAAAEAERQRLAAAEQEKAAAAERQSAADAERKRAADEAAALKARQQEEAAEQARADAAAARARLESTSTSSATGGGAAASGLGAGAAAGAAAASTASASVSRGTKPAGISGPRAGGADDLKVIKGVGPKMENMLHGMGYYHYDQIADWKQAEVDWVDDNLEGFKGRVTRDQWVPQAKILAGGGRIDEDAWAEGRVQADGKSAPDYDGDGVREGKGEGTRPEALSGPRGGKADNLKEIKGVGPKMEKLLWSLGFYHFDQVASWSADEVAWVDANLEGFKGRVSRDEWVKQAKILADGGDTEFSKRVDKGGVY